MKYTLPKSYSNAGIAVEIPDNWLKTKRAELGSTKAAIDLYLFENAYMRPDEHDREKGNVTSVKKTSTRTRQPDETKRAIIAALYACLLESNDIQNVEVTNIERVIAFSLGDDNYEVTLSKKRKPKA